MSAGEDPRDVRMAALERNIERLELEVREDDPRWTWERAVKALRTISEAPEPELWRLMVQTLAIGEGVAERMIATKTPRASALTTTPARLPPIAGDQKVIDLLAWTRERVER